MNAPTLNPGRAMLLATVSEEQFLQFVLGLAERHGWLAYHTRDSRRSNHGFPDVIAVRNGVLIAAELKRKGGRATAPQQRWLTELELAGVQCFVWRPEDEAEIEAALA